jgi:hypothetical protein
VIRRPRLGIDWNWFLISVAVLMFLLFPLIWNAMLPPGRPVDVVQPAK